MYFWNTFTFILTEIENDSEIRVAEYGTMLLQISVFFFIVVGNTIVCVCLCVCNRKWMLTRCDRQNKFFALTE